MLKKIVAATVAVFASACIIDDGVKGTPGSISTDKTPDDPSDDTPQDEPTTVTATRQRQPSPNDPAMCSLLPQDDSACAHACDEGALLGYIPEGTCATFSCPLSDGTTLVTGGCN